MSDLIFPAIGNGGLFTVPNTVVDQFLKDADQAALRFILYYFRKGGGIELEEACEYLGVTAASIEKSVNFWLSSGVLVRTKSGIYPNMAGIVFDSKPLIKKQSEKPKYEFREISKEISNNRPLYTLIQSVQSMFSRTLSPEAIKTIYSFYDYYGMPTEVIYILVDFCTKNGKDNIKYIEQVAHSWYSSGITSEERAHEYVVKYEASKARQTEVMRIFGISGRSLSSKEKERIKKWTEDFGFDNDMIRLAYDRCVDSTGKSGFAYIDKILTSWFEKGYKTYAEAEAEQPPEKKEKNKSGRGKTGEATFSAEDFAKWEFTQKYMNKEDK